MKSFLWAIACAALVMGGVVASSHYIFKEPVTLALIRYSLTYGYGVFLGFLCGRFLPR